MEDVESEEVPLITKRFVPPSKLDDNPTSESETCTKEEPYDLDMTNIEINKMIAYRSYELAKQLKVVG